MTKGVEGELGEAVGAVEVVEGEEDVVAEVEEVGEDRGSWMRGRVWG